MQPLVKLKIETKLNLRFTIRTFVVALVCFHVEYHVAFCTLETRLVPCLKMNNNKKRRIMKIIARFVSNKKIECLQITMIIRCVTFDG